MLVKALVAILVSLSGTFAFGKVLFEDPTYDEFDGLELAEVLIRDQHFTDAKQILSDLKEDSFQKNVLLGQISLGKKDSLSADRWFDRAAAMRTDSKERTRFVLLYAQTALANKNYQKCTRLLTPPKNVEQALLSSLCFEKNGQMNEANVALQKFVLDENVFVARILFLVRRKLYEVAKQDVVSRIDKGLSLKSLFFLLNQLEDHQDLRISLVEAGLMKYPRNQELILFSVQIQYKIGNFQKVGELFSTASELDPKFHYHAAEAFRQSGDFLSSERHGQMIRDRTERLKHLAALFVDQADFQRLLGIEHQLLRSPLSSNDEISYALAYSHAQTGSFSRMEASLKRIKGDRTQLKAQKLKTALALCQKGEGSCQL